MSTQSTPFLNDEEVQKNLPINELISGVEKSFVHYSTKQEGVSQPERVWLPISDKNYFLFKPALSLPDKTFSTKLLGYYPDNERLYGVPSHNSVILVFNSDTGVLEGVMNGQSVTNLRTAAATGVAIKHLSKETDSILAVIGTGQQAESHIKLLKEIRNYKEIRVFGRTTEKAKALADKYGIIACDTVEDAVKNADVIVTAVFSSEPVLCYNWVKPGALINSIGAVLPDTREIDDKLMQTSQLFVDATEASYEKAGDIIGSKANIHGELGNLISGILSADWNNTRIFKSNGMALQDLVAGRIVIDNYRKNLLQ